MYRTKWLALLAIIFSSSHAFSQSELSRQLQQKLSTRKATKSATESQAPTENPGASLERFQAKTPTEFTESLHLAVATKNLEAYNGLVSWGTILNSATSNLQGKQIDEFRTTFAKDIKSTNSLGAKIIQTVKSGGTYEFLQLTKNKNTVVAIFRMLLPGGKGVNYHEYALAKTKAGQVVASDIYVYLTGENLSKTIRRNLVSALSDQETGSSVKLSGKDELLSDHVATIKSLNEALAKSDANGARTQILKLPMELRNDKAIQALTLNVYRNSKSFKTVLGGVRKACPDDVFMDMIAIDVMVRQKQYDDAITAIERINTKVGGDPYMKILHGRMLLNKGDEKNGRRLIQESVSEDDGILTGYWSLVSFSLKDKDHAQTLKLLKKIHLRFGVKFKDLRDIPSYKTFVTSVEFQQWTKYLESSEVSAPESDPKSEGESTTASKSRTASQLNSQNK